jgi:hypothetical protein
MRRTCPDRKPGRSCSSPTILYPSLAWADLGLLLLGLLLLALPLAAGCPSPQPRVQLACPACPACPRCPACPGGAGGQPAAGQPAAGQPASRPASQQAASRPAQLRPPPRSGIFTRRRAPFTSLDQLLARHRLRGATARRFGAALAPHIGSVVRWRLRSWGGEVSSRGYHTPGGHDPPGRGPVEHGRIRLISPSLGPGASLSTVQQAHHPVVCCLARFPDGGQARFHRSDGKRRAAPGLGEFTIEGTIWGVLHRGGVDLWLHDCEIVARH